MSERGGRPTPDEDAAWPSFVKFYDPSEVVDDPTVEYVDEKLIEVRMESDGTVEVDIE